MKEVILETGYYDGSHFDVVAIFYKICNRYHLIGIFEKRYRDDGKVDKRKINPDEKDFDGYVSKFERLIREGLIK